MITVPAIAKNWRKNFLKGAAGYFGEKNHRFDAIWIKMSKT